MIWLLCKQVLGFCCQSINSESAKILSAIKTLAESSLDRLFTNLSLCTCIMVFQDLLRTCDFLEARHLYFLTCKAEIDLILYSSGFCRIFAKYSSFKSSLAIQTHHKSSHHDSFRNCLAPFFVSIISCNLDTYFI